MSSHSASKSASGSPAPPSRADAAAAIQSSLTSPPPENRHSLTPVERQRQQLARLLKEPSKPVHIPAPPKEKTIRPAREMIKNVQGSSAGAGSGEFHVYKASRRREYERLKLLDEKARRMSAEEEFKVKMEQWEAEAEAKTAKNRARREKKKMKAKTKSKEGTPNQYSSTSAEPSEKARDGRDVAPLKKRRLIGGTEIVFRKPGEFVSDDEDENENENEREDEEDEGPGPRPQVEDLRPEDQPSNAVVEESKIRIIEDD